MVLPHNIQTLAEVAARQGHTLYSNSLGKAEYEEIAGLLIMVAQREGQWVPLRRKRITGYSVLIDDRTIDEMIEAGYLEEDNLAMGNSGIEGVEYRLSDHAIDIIAHTYPKLCLVIDNEARQ